MRKLLFLLIVSILFFPTVALSGQTSITSSGYYCSSDSFSSGNNNYTCSAGTIFPSGSGELCTYNQTPCAQQTSTPSCPSGYAWNGSTCTETTTQTQTASPNCPYGKQPTLQGDRCILQTIYPMSLCFLYGYAYIDKGDVDVCADTTPACPEFSGASGECLYSSSSNYLYYYPSCPSGYTYDSSTEQCTETITTTQTASPTCPSGTTLVNGECVSPWTCPVSGNGGDSATCIEPSGSSTYYCSPYSCYTDSSGTNVSTTPVNATMPPTQTNNGTVTDSGCDGSVYLFPGTAMQCRSGGEQTAWQDCCNASTYLFGMLKCTTQEESVAKDLQYDTQYGANGYNNPNSYGGSGDAQYVGSYCSDKFFGLCLENMKVYCVFHSLLGLIIQEQGRAQLGIGFGSPHNPDCSGLTPTQFQELNFSNFDFTEYVTVLENKIKAGVINTNTLNQMQNYTTTITNQISNYENELSGVNP